MMGVFNEEQRQAIRDFEKSVRELLEALEFDSGDIQTLEVCMSEVTQDWETLQAQLANEDDEEP